MADNLKGLSKKINSAMDDALEKIAVEVGYEIEELYESVIEQFYNDYHPRRYRRTFSSFLGSDSYALMQDPVMQDDGYIVGVSVSPNTIPGEPYRAKKDWVFERTFRKGYHGYKNIEIRNWRSKKKNHALIKEKKYFFNRPDDMHVMSPSPEKLMEKGVKKLYKSLPKKYNQMFVDELTKSIQKG